MGNKYRHRLQAVIDRRRVKREEDQKLSDPWQGAVDSGSGVEFPAYPGATDEELGTELILTLKPEVLAQLQRIETLLARIWREVAPSSESDVNVLLPDD